jgi:sec-independent protein translocase protein TatC
MKNKRTTFVQHLAELRNRIIFSIVSIILFSVVSYIFYEKIIKILIRPFLYINDFNNAKLFLSTIYEGFLIRIKISIYSGIVLSSPVIIFNLIKFIFPGLTLKERRFVLITLLTSLFLSSFAVYYSYQKIVPLSIKFLSSKSFIPQKVGLLLNFNRNINFIIQLIFAGILLFQLPLIIELLLFFNILKRKTIIKFVRYIIVLIFILSAILTPPDVLSQLAFALPLTFLLFLAIFIAKIFKFGE